MTNNSIESLMLLIAISLSYSTVLRRLERLRRAVTLDRVPDMLGVWTFAGAVLLPAPLLIALVVIVNLGEWPSRKAVGNGRAWKYAYSTGATAVSCLLAAALVHRVGGVAGLLVGAPAFWAVNFGLVVVALCASNHAGVVLKMLRHWRAQVLDVGTQLLGGALALAMGWHPALVLTAVPCLWALHQFCARQLIEETAAFDPATGLWSETAWTVQATDNLADAPGCVLLMLVDPAAPDCEPRIAAVLASVFGRSEPVGRYGSRQVVLVSQVDLASVGRILSADARDALQDADIACQVGIAISVGEDLDALLLRAGQDLMRRRAEAGVSARW